MTGRSPASLHLTNAYHATSGGIRTFFGALLSGVNDRERAVHLVVPAERDGTECVGRHGRIHYVAARRAPGFDRRYRLITPRHYARRHDVVRTLIDQARPDIVEICDKYSLAPLAWRLRHDGPVRPTLVGFSAERMDDNVAAWVSEAPLVRKLAHHYLRHVYVPAFDGHLANSAYTADELATCGARDVQMCPMGVDVQAFSAATHDAALRGSLLGETGGTGSSQLLLYAGRVSPEKHLDLVIDAVATLVNDHPSLDPRLVVLGEGPALPALKALAARRCQGRVAFLSHVADRRLLAQHYAAADAFVHPNPREPFGIGPLEAMAAGVPVVVPRAGGVLSYASDDNAWLAAPGSRGLAFAVWRALVAGRGDARIASARKTAESYAWRGVVDRYFRLLDGVHVARLARPTPASSPVSSLNAPSELSGA